MSATIEAKTKGIWVWCVPHPMVKGRCLALMDTEGLGDPMKVHTSTSVEHENRNVIFITCDFISPIQDRNAIATIEAIC